MHTKAYQDFIYTRTYSRWLEDKNRRENWIETVERYKQFFEPRVPEHLKEEFYNAINNIIIREVMPSMRALWSAGPALERENLAGYNCAAAVIDRMEVFGEILYILMCGTGVGFSVERQFISKLPDIPILNNIDSTIIFEDSKEGWAQGFNNFIETLYKGFIPEFDLHRIRPKGAPLKIFGGRASGPAPLRHLLEYTVALFKRAQGRKLNSIECHDLVCTIANCVIVGGVRRSATISLSNFSDMRMRHAKDGHFYIDHPERNLANNSVAYTEKPDTLSFMEEWLSLARSGSGERGIINRQSMQQSAKKCGRKDDISFVVNPCVTGDTPILTDKGYVPIIDTIGIPTNIWNGIEFSEVTPFETGYNPVLQVELSDGSYLKCTPYHKFILASNDRVKAESLCIGDKLAKFNMPVVKDGETYAIDAYSQGFYSGDGNKGYTYSYVYSTKYTCIDRLVGEFKDTFGERKLWKHGPMLDKSFVPIKGSIDYCINWLAGLFDSDGTVLKNDNSINIQVVSIDKEFLQNVRLMLTRLGVQAKVNKAKDETYKDIKGKIYLCRDLYRLCINAQDVSTLIECGIKTNRLIIPTDNNPNRDARRFVTVKSIKELPAEYTYCFNEPKNNSGTFNGIVTAQCGEVVLRPNQLCNLTEAVIRAEDSLESVFNKIRYATILGVLQATLTQFNFVSDEWKNNVEEERLLGVSLTGICDNSFFATPSAALKDTLERLNVYCQEVANEWADALKINRPTARTTVKPSGTVSQLVNSSSGIHPRYSKYYIRRVRVTATDPVAKYLVDKGLSWQPEVGEFVENHNTKVFEFPIKSPDNCVTRHNVTALDQLELWKFYKQYWTDHNPSCTIYVDDSEWLTVGAWVYENWDKIGGLSFLPKDGGVYPLAPYEEITKEEYEELSSNFPELNFNDLYEYEKVDSTEGAREFACVGGVCELV